MQKRNFIAILLMVLLNISVFSQGNINTMFYNLLNFPEAPPLDRRDILTDILSEYQPDLFMVCELQSVTGANSVLSCFPRTDDDSYRAAQFISNQSSPGSNFQQLVFYNSNKLILENQTIITTSLRDINHYIFILKTLDFESDPIYLDVFVTHLKASQGLENEQIRLQMVNEFTKALLNLPSDHYVIFAGDLNLYSSNESAYQELLDPTNNIILKDPIDRPGGWHDNINFQDIHTQSTRITNNDFDDFGAGGGLDDRFDFILISENLETSSKLHYVNDTYRAFGNNGKCFNQNINDYTCDGTEYDQSLRDNLYNMSDHLPVVLQLQTDQVLNINENVASNEYLKFKNGNVILNSIELELDMSIIGRQINIFNSLGQKVQYINAEKTLMQIDVTNLSGGVYYIAIQNETLTNPLKFIKL